MLNVHSVYMPAIFRSTLNGHRYLIGGRIFSINGQAIKGAVRVAEHITLKDINWTPYLPKETGEASCLDRVQQAREVSVAGSRGARYTVTVDNLGVPFACTCTGFLYRRQCKHLKMV